MLERTLSEETQAPTGLTRRRRRLSEDETARRMLQTAVAVLGRQGLTVSLDHISLEEVIREADVARSAVYRRWPYKDLFFRDVVIELAKSATPTVIEDEIRVLRQVVGEHEAWLESAELRTGLVVELFRQLGLLDFEALYNSAAWRTYLALNATFMSIADGEARSHVGAALAESEAAHVAAVAASWHVLAGLFGFRLRPATGASFELLAKLLDATLRGLVLAALSDPDIATERIRARPEGAIAEAEWSLPALSGLGVAWGLLEPDPAAVWDEQRIATVRETLRTLRWG